MKIVKSIIEKVKSVSMEKIKELEDRIKRNEELVPLRFYEDILSFVQYCQKEVVEVDLLRNFYDYLENVKEFENYEKLNSSIEYSKKVEGKSLLIDEYLNSSAKQMLTDLIKSCNSLINKINSVHQKNGLLNREKAEAIAVINLLDNVLSKYENNILIDEDEIKKLQSYIEENDCVIVSKNITQSNSIILDNKTKNETKKDEEKYKEETKEEIKKDDLTFTLSKEDEKLYLKALKIVEYYEDVTKGNISIVNDQIKDDMSFSQRTSIYDAQLAVEDRIEISAYDLKTNILPKIRKQISERIYDKESFLLLNDVYDYCYKCEQQLNNNDKEENIVGSDKKENITDNDKQKILEKVNGFLNKLNVSIENDKDTEKEPILKEWQDILIGYKFQFVQCLSNNEGIYEAYEQLKYILEDIEAKYEKLLSTITDLEVFKELSEEFYGDFSLAKNIIVFMDNSNGYKSNIEQDMLELSNINKNDYAKVIDKLKKCVNDNFINHGNHHVKGDYSSDFFEKYDPRSMSNGNTRIFYSRFGTKLDQIYNFNEKRVNLLFIYQIGRANDGLKADDSANALRRLNKDRHIIDEYIELFNTDFNSLTSIEKENKKQQIEEILNEQSLKLGHLINTYNEMEKTDKKGTRL